MGSSMRDDVDVRWLRLMRSMIQARVVDLPLPAGPVTNTSPLERFESSMMLSGICRVSGEGRSKRTYTDHCRQGTSLFHDAGAEAGEPFEGK